MIERILDMPHATLLSYLAIALALIGYLAGDLSYDQAIIAAGIGTAGAAGLGVARNGSGRGLKK